MDTPSKPLIGVLVATVIVFALYMVELRPKSGSGANSATGSGQSLGAYSTDIAKAQGAVAISNASNARSGQLSPTPPSTTSTPSGSAPASAASGGAGHSTSTNGATKATTTSSSQAKKTSAASSSHANSASHTTSKTSSKAPSTPAARASAVAAAIREHKVLALLFYNPAGADDQAVDHELNSVSTHHGAVFKLAIPVAELANYVSLTEQVPINLTPTLVVIGRNGQAGEIAGFTDTFEINQRIADALATKP
jgi:hypothetical protein